MKAYSKKYRDGLKEQVKSGARTIKPRKAVETPDLAAEQPAEPVETPDLAEAEKQVRKPRSRKQS